MYTKQMFTHDLEEVIGLLEKEAKTLEQGLPSEGIAVGNQNITGDWLRRVFIAELEMLLYQTKTNTLPPRGKRQIGSVWHATDQWSNKSSRLSEKFGNLANNYREKLE